MATVYDAEFYKSQADGSSLSAEVIIPLIFDFYQPQSVADVGCGVGTWLNVFQSRHGVKQILGIDGAYVEGNRLRIPKDQFMPFDLSTPLRLKEKYDMAISLEVGEHLPESVADTFIDSITGLSDVVVFSAAIPGQIGTSHVNEQYTEYWAQKFMQRGYVAIDFFRKKIWNHPDVEWWYKQNIILYIKQEAYDAKFAGKLAPYLAATDPQFFTRIHPDMLRYFVGKYFDLHTLRGFLGSKFYPIKKRFLKKQSRK